MKGYRLILTIGLLLTVVLAGCVTPPAPAPTSAATPTNTPLPPPTSAPTAPAARTVTIMSHDSFNVSEEVVAAFQAACNCQVQFLKSGDTGLALNKAILSKANPLADVFYGVDNTFLSRALAADIFEPYASPALAGIPADLKLDPGNRLLPVDFGYVTLNYDKEYFADNQIPLPGSLRDLTDPAYKGLLVVENPATSSPGLAFLLTTVAAFGETGDYTYLDFWRDLRANDVLVTDGWEDAYYGQFSGGSGEGDRPLVVSYATSPAAEVFFADPQPSESPTGNLLFPAGSFKQIEFVGILKGAREPELARQWVDFMLGDTFQADIPLQMWVYPARNGTPLPEVFQRFAEVPAEPATLTPAQIETNRERWLQAWTDVVLR
ncbi:MAG: thiamine ABC transporter substrate-binding protein [Anaerolineae bacterium]